MKTFKELWPIKAMFISLAYIAIMGIGMYIMHHIVGSDYSNPKMVYTLIWVELILSLFSIFIIKKYSSWEKMWFEKLNKKGLLWFLPIIIIALIALGNLSFDLFNSQISSSQIILLLVIACTTFLVGFSEELMFRWILMRSFTNKNKIFTGVLVSSIMFSLLHIVNILWGSALSAVYNQLIFTFIFGLALWFISLKLKNIWPLIIFHALWDFMIFSHTVLGTKIHFITGFISIVEIAIVIIISISIFKKKK